MRRINPMWAAIVIGVTASTSCVIGPKYIPPLVQTPAQYKEAGPAGLDDWKSAQPADTAPRGEWWKAFQDKELNELELQVNASNQTLAASVASFAEARALVRAAKSQYFPTVTAGASINNSRLSNFGPYTAGVTYTAFSLPFDVSWEPDLWGRVRHTVQASQYAAQAGAADIQNVRLTVQAEMAADYYQLRAQDALKELLDSSIAAYTDDVRITRAQYQGGTGTDEAVAQAEAQLEATKAQDISITAVRAQYEHAVAVLAGKAPSGFSLPRSELPADPPAVPLSVPSTLLERRPDIAAAERLVAQANARIGMARAAFFPNVTLNVSAGFTGLEFTKWLNWPSRVWSAGPSISETIFDAGLRRATVQQYRAAYDQAVANYRQTVLSAFQEVEDNLCSLRLLPAEIESQDAAVHASARALEEANARYTAGLDSYLNVLNAQTVMLSAEQIAVNLQVQQITATVQLIKALGGGWDVSQLPSPKSVGSD